MALRDLSISGETATSGGSSAVSGLPFFWDSTEAAPKTNWEEWWDLFMVAANAKCSISVNKILRTATEQQPRVAAVINNLNEQAADRKILIVLFFISGVCRKEKPYR